MRYRFSLESEDSRHRRLPDKLIVGRRYEETEVPILLRVLGFLVFFRDGLQLQVNLRQETIPFMPDLVQLDYALVPRFWAECGECSLKKLDKLRAKLPRAELWILRGSFEEAELLRADIAKANLRRGRFNILGFDSEMIEEMSRLLEGNNHIHWVGDVSEIAHVQFDMNGLWFDFPYKVISI